MRIGIISDTHDNLPAIEKAVIFLNAQKLEYVLHAGDFVAPFTVRKLNALTCPWQGVFGNNDGEKKGLSEASAGKIQEGPLRLELAGRRITVVHDINTVNPEEENADIIVCGHTHRSEITKRGRILIINPGELGGWLTGISSAAILDTQTFDAAISKFE